MAEAKKINLLQRDGTSQKMRMPAALDPSFAKIDDKSIKDLLAFAKIYSNELNFFNESIWHRLYGFLGFVQLTKFRGGRRRFLGFYRGDKSRG